MPKKTRQRNKKRLLIILLLAILVVAGSFFLLRAYLLSRVVELAKQECRGRWHAELNLEGVRWTGLATLQVGQAKAERGGGAIFTLRGAEAQLNLWGMLTGGRRLGRVHLEEFHLHLEGSADGGDHGLSGIRLPHLPEAIADLPATMRWLPTELHVGQASLTRRSNSWIRLSECDWKDGDAKGSLAMQHGDASLALLIRGRLDPGTLQGDLVIGGMEEEWRISTAAVEAGEIWKWQIQVQAGGFTLQHKAVSRLPLRVAGSQAQLLVAGDGARVWLQDGSKWGMGRVELLLGGCEHVPSTHAWKLRVESSGQPAAQCLEALPQPSLLPQMEVSGKVDFVVEVKVPQGILGQMEVHFPRLDLGLVPDTTGWRQMLSHPLALFQKPFDLRPDGSMRLLHIDREAASHCKLAEIPLHLQWAVVLAEDPNFFGHKGIDTTVLRKAISDNLQDGKFSRGGSTITMQLAKNTHLSRTKDLHRKLSQVLLASMIEHLPGVEKGDILELYLNVIEWGPEVYGIREAAQRHFGKQPSALTLDESLFLALIIPNPRQYATLLDAEGHPTDEAVTVMEMLKFQMWEQQIIDDDALDAPIAVTVRPRASGH